MRRWWLLWGLVGCGSSMDPGSSTGTEVVSAEGISDEEPAADTGCADCDSGGPVPEAGIRVPLGETLFFDGDDYLADLGADPGCVPTVVSAPDGAAATVMGSRRLTPDAVGLWEVACGDYTATLDIRDDTLNADTFLNYNYTPVGPIAAVGETSLLVATPTSNAVQLVSTGAEPAAGTLIPTGAWPTSVAWWEDGDRALVAMTGRDALGFVDVRSERVVDAIRVGDEPAGILVDGDLAYVTISGEDRVVVVDLREKTVLASADTGRDPRALTLSPDRRYLYVASLLSSNEHRHGTDALPTEALFQRDLTVIDTASFTVVQTVPELGTMLRGMWTDGERLIVGVSHSNNDLPDVDGTVRPHAHGLAVLPLVDGLPTGAVEHIDLDRRDGSAGPAPSPFSIVATPDGSQLVVSLSAGASLLVLDRDTLDEVARLPTGNDPRGLVAHGDHIWTAAWLDNALHGFALPLESGAEPDVQLETGNDPRPEEVRRGQQLFNDARFSASGEFSCNNCHIDGVVDGLTWDLLVDGNVNTLAFRNVAGTDPFLWAGVLPTLFDFSREVLKLVGANASGADMEALTTYMQSITAPPNPHTLPGGRLTDAGTRGKALFEASVADGGAGCAACHNGPLFTNQALVVGKTDSLETDVPGLIGVYDSAPYGRKGSWATLPDMVSAAADYTGAHSLTDDQKADLLAYLQQIPGDALWLNGSLPLAGDDYVSPLTDVTLTFSAVLASGQSDHAHIVRIDDAGAEHPVEGAWEASGRRLRFVPTAELLEDTTYEVTVAAGLVSDLGRVLHEPLSLQWRTGAHAAVDVSGRHLVTLRVSEAIPGLLDEDPAVEFSLIQSSGGNVTAVVHYDDLGLEMSHAEGVVVGSRFLVEPFRVDTDFGQLQLDAAYLDTTDLDGDGFSDEGVGEFETFGFVIPWDAVRLSLPD